MNKAKYAVYLIGIFIVTITEKVFDRLPTNTYRSPNYDTDKNHSV
ncbi:hypothetical protein [Fictibacillus terranigra]|uniref:Cyclic lactone autoinducer peptide n=1 Tax=Fictibacillus terranigra TaxID=3058424 RepID=A0ABT8E1I7_9BACL|nr:hypothetical protein [Fictibacillus sp. CENA-BCM004]MDN4071741.1 hypothetical protein [Fictibacillus sp. CENA-BCM004]